MNWNSETLSQMAGGLYTWLLATYFGAVSLDIAYSRQLNVALMEAQVAHGEASDFLFFILGLVLLTGLIAVGLSWRNQAARNLFTASVSILIALAGLAFLVLFPLARSTPEAPLLRYRQLLRLAPIGLASVLSMLGFGQLSKKDQTS